MVEFINSKLARDFPDNKFEIVGSVGNKILSKPKKNVRIEGYVNDVRKYFSENTIFICPMDTGSGIKNKIMEAIAMESVVIATEMSLEGFSPQILEHLFISKNIKAFSDTLSQSINDFDILNRRTKKLRLILKKEYDWHEVALKYFGQSRNGL